MNTAVDVFINGLVGVFTGITALYVMMKILAATAGRPPVTSPPPARKAD